jgi:hypothetical protein
MRAIWLTDFWIMEIKQIAWGSQGLVVPVMGMLPIPGTKRRKYLEQNLAATTIELTEADLSQLESIVPMGTDTGAPYDEFSMGLID